MARARRLIRSARKLRLTASASPYETAYGFSRAVRVGADARWSGCGSIGLSFSLGCGSWGGNGTNNNITWRDLINETWVSKPLATPKTLPSDEGLFGPVMARVG